MRSPWLFPVAHLVFQLYVWLVLGGSWLFVVVALVFLAVVAFFQSPRRFRSFPVFRTLPDSCAAPWACPVCSLDAVERRRSA